MKRISNVVSCVLFTLIIIVMFVLPATALTEKSTFTGIVATSSFDTINGCIEDFVSVACGEDPQQGAFVVISYLQANNCTEPPTLLTEGFAVVSGLPQSAVQISPSLKSAELNTTILVFDAALQADVPVALSLTWVGTGNLFLTMSHSLVHLPGFTTIDRGHTKSRSAQASGDVTVNGVNFTPEPSIDAGIESFMDGSLTVSH